VTSTPTESKQIKKKLVREKHTNQEAKLTDVESRKRLNMLEKKLRSIEDAEFKFSAVRSKAKKRGGKEKRDSKDKHVIKREIEKIRSELGIKSKSNDSEVGQLGQLLEAINVSNDNLFCKLCQVRVPDEAALVDHVSGKRHRKMMARRTSSSGDGNSVVVDTEEVIVKPFIMYNPATPVKIPVTRHGANPPSTPISVPCKSKNISTTPPLVPGLPSSSQKRQSTSLSSSIGSNCSWTSSVHSGLVNMLDIMHEEETNSTIRSRKQITSSIANSPHSAYSSPVRATVAQRSSVTSPIYSRAAYSPVVGVSKSQNSYSLGSFMKDADRKAMNYRCQSPSAWGSTDSEPSPISKRALQEIQNEQQHESVATHSLETSSWGYNTTQGESLTSIQQEQEKLALERQSEILARKLQEQEACLQANISQKRHSKYKNNRKSKPNHQTSRGTTPRKRTPRKNKQIGTN